MVKIHGEFHFKNGVCLEDDEVFELDDANEVKKRLMDLVKTSFMNDATAYIIFGGLIVRPDELLAVYFNEVKEDGE